MAVDKKRIFYFAYENLGKNCRFEIPALFLNQEKLFQLICFKSEIISIDSLDSWFYFIQRARKVVYQYK